MAEAAYDVDCRNSLRGLLGLPLRPAAAQRAGAKRLAQFSARYRALAHGLKGDAPGVQAILTHWPAVLQAAMEVFPPAVTADPAAIDAVRQRLQAYLTHPGLGYYALMPSDITIHMCEAAWFSQAKIASPSLDLGIGAGFLSHFLLTGTGQRMSAGTDLLAESVAAAARLAPAVYDHYQTADMTALPYGDDVFGTVFAIHALDHVAERPKALGEIARVLAPGGEVWLSDVTPFWDPFKPFPQIFTALTGLDIGAPWREWSDERHGARDTDLDLPDYCGLLESLGLEVLEYRYFLSERLMRTAYMFFDMQYFFGGFAEANLEADPAAMALYRRLLFDVLAPLIAADPALCALEEKGASLMIRARKPGHFSPRALADQDLRCPETGAKLAWTEAAWVAESGGPAYPRIKGIDLLCPVYADQMRQLKGGGLVS